MKRYPAPKTPESVIHEIRQMAAEGCSQEALIARMRQLGLSIIPSIKLLSDVTGMSGNDAKYAVHMSETWRDWLDTYDAVHDGAIEAAKLLGAEVVERDAEPLLQLASK